MEKKADSGLWQSLANHSRHQHQMIVMYPYEVAWSIRPDNGIRERLAYFFEDIPTHGMERKVVESVMHEGPQDSVGYLLIEPLDLGPREMNRDDT